MERLLSWYSLEDLSLNPQNPCKTMHSKMGLQFVPMEKGEVEGEDSPEACGPASSAIHSGKQTRKRTCLKQGRRKRLASEAVL